MSWNSLRSACLSAPLPLPLPLLPTCWETRCTHTHRAPITAFSKITSGVSKESPRPNALSAHLLD